VIDHLQKMPIGPIWRRCDRAQRSVRGRLVGF
jgi:hypothetical protein